MQRHSQLNYKNGLPKEKNQVKEKNADRYRHGHAGESKSRADGGGDQQSDEDGGTSD